MDPENDTPQQQTEGTDATRQQPSRGEFLKWGTVALGGMYVGPKVTSFAVDKSMGQAGSPPPTPPHFTPPSPSPLPPTGGAAGIHSSGNAAGVPTWLPAAGAGAAALGLYAKTQAKSSKTAKVETGDSESAE